MTTVKEEEAWLEEGGPWSLFPQTYPEVMAQVVLHGGKVMNEVTFRPDMGFIDIPSGRRVAGVWKWRPYAVGSKMVRGGLDSPTLPDVVMSYGPTADDDDDDDKKEGE